jgi:hypothetical protein
MSKPHHALMMRPKLVLSETRYRGPDRSRNTSGVCSTCGEFFLRGWTMAIPNPTRSVFELKSRISSDLSKIDHS